MDIQSDTRLVLPFVQSLLSACWAAIQRALTCLLRRCSNVRRTSLPVGVGHLCDLSQKRKLCRPNSASRRGVAFTTRGRIQTLLTDLFAERGFDVRRDVSLDAERKLKPTLSVDVGCWRVSILAPVIGVLRDWSIVSHQQSLSTKHPR